MKTFKIGKVSDAMIDGVLMLQASVTVTEQTGVRHGEHGEEIPIIKTERFMVGVPVADIPIEDEQQYLKTKVLEAYEQYAFDLTKYVKYEGMPFVDE